MTQTAQKIWNRSDVTALILENQNALERAVIRLYAKQTQDEKTIKYTKHVNNVGFNKPDAPFLSSMAGLLNRGYTLSDKQVYVTRKKMLKYWKQLLLEIEAKGGKVSYE